VSNERWNSGRVLTESEKTITMKELRKIWGECSRSNQPDLIIGLPEVWDMWDEIINAPLWKRILWRVTFGYFPN